MQRIAGARAALAAVAAAGLACATGPVEVEYASDGSSRTTSDGLYRVGNWAFDDAFAKPGAQLAQYDRVIVEVGRLEYKRPRHPAHVSRDGIARGTFLLPPHTEAAFKRYLQAALTAAFEGSPDFGVTDQPAPQTLRVTAHILDVVSYIPPDRGWGQATTTFLANRGEFTLILDVRDAQTGAPLLRLVDRSAISLDGADAYLPCNPVTTAAAARQVFREAALRLRRRLELLRALPEIPPPPSLALQRG